jgi:two-component system, chemotaxis family, CheB/CheR fusion protein
LEAANRELIEANLQLRQANEEMVLRQEEVQAADEEVRTLNEELQATNEELETLNEELEATAEELRATNDDLAAQSRELQQMVEQREAQRVASENARARLAAILAQMSEPVLVVDSEGQPFLTNRSYESLFGESGTTTPPVALHDLEGRPLGADATPQARVRERVPFQMEFTFTNAAGAQRWFVAQGQPVLDQNDGPLGGIVTLHEITDSTLRTIRERFLKHAISELHTPVTALLVLANSLQRLLGQRRAEVEHGGLHEVAVLALQQTAYLRILVDDLADPHREANTAFEVRRVSMDLVALLQQTLEVLELGRTAGEVGALTRPQIHLEVTPGAPLWIFADPMRVEQIVVNLVTEVLATAPEGAHMLLRVRKAQDWAQIEFTHDGHGAHRDAAPHPLPLSRQAVVPDITNPEGLGLGLRVVAQLVAAHDGTIGIQQEPGQGATFVVRFPLSSAVDANQPSAQ